MKPMMSTAMTNVGNFHIHPGEVVYAEQNKGTKTWLLSHTKSHQGVFATVGSLTTFEPYPIREEDQPVNQVVTVSEACDILGVDRSRVHQLLERKKLVGRKSGKGWILDRQSVEARAKYYENA